jgi:hypothetical protein
MSLATVQNQVVGRRAFRLPPWEKSHHPRASDRVDPRAPLQLHFPCGAGQLPPCCGPPPRGPWASDYGGRSLRSCEAEPSAEVTGSFA